MPIWGWFAIASGIGATVGLEAWAWLRHGTSAIALIVTGGAVLAVVAAIGYGIFGGVVEGGSGAAAHGSRCDPNYRGACLDPNAVDYDCAGGSGNGPKYVEGPVQVVGDDHYGLDRDGNGVGCE